MTSIPLPFISSCGLGGESRAQFRRSDLLSDAYHDSTLSPPPPRFSLRELGSKRFLCLDRKRKGKSRTAQFPVCGIKLDHKSGSEKLLFQFFLLPLPSRKPARLITGLHALLFR